MDNINYDQEIEKQAHPENFDNDDEFHGGYCENCHIATGDCDCPKDTCDICEDAREN